MILPFWGEWYNLINNLDEFALSGSPSNGNLDPPPAMLSLQQFQRSSSCFFFNSLSSHFHIIAFIICYIIYFQSMNRKWKWFLNCYRIWRITDLGKQRCLSTNICAFHAEYKIITWGFTINIAYVVKITLSSIHDGYTTPTTTIGLKNTRAFVNRILISSLEMSLNDGLV